MSPKGDGITLRQIGEDHFEARYRENGIQKRRRYNCTPEQAVLIKASMMARTGRTGKAEHTFHELADAYLKWAVRQKSHQEKGYVFKFLKSHFGDCSLSSINTLALDHLQGEMLEAEKAPATINRHISCLKHAYTKAEEWGWVDEKTCKGVHKVKMLPENNKRLRYLSDEEYRRLIEACQIPSATFLIPIIQIAVNTGMRLGEILNLTWDDVDQRNGLILLQQGMTKTKQRREIPMNNNVKAAIKGLPVRVDGGRIFSVNRIYEPFMQAVKRAKIRDFHFHDLRHTFASWLVMKGVDLATLQSLLGHANIQMSLRYAHLSPNHRKSAVNVLDNPQITTFLFKPAYFFK